MSTAETDAIEFVDVIDAFDVFGAFGAVDAAEGWPSVDVLASLEDLLGFEPGPGIITYLNGLDLTALDGHERSVVLSLIERHQSWLAAFAVTVTALVAGPTPPPPDPKDRDARDADGRIIEDPGPYEVAAALGMTSAGAAGRVDVARALTEWLPKCRLAMAAGIMNYRQGWLVADAVAPLDAKGKAAVDARVASLIGGQSWAAFRRTLRRAVLAAAPDLVLAEHAAAMRTRDVDLVHLDNTVMGEVRVTMSAIDAQTVWQGLDATAMQLQNAARAAGELDAGIGAYRSDALLAWANHALADPDAPRRHGRRPQVGFVIDLPSLLGLADNPAELLDYGPIPSCLVRDRAGAGDWRRLVVDPVSGYLLDYGSGIYRPPQDLRDYLIARDRHCRFPGCNHRATHCDVDHNTPAPAGATSAKNCCCLCRRHHRLKTFGGWIVQLKPDGTALWTSPCGRQFVSDHHPNSTEFTGARPGLVRTAGVGLQDQDAERMT